MLKQPERFLRTLAKEAGFALGSQFAAGLVFLPHDDAEAARCRETLRTALAEVRLAVAGWRQLPVDADACGATARANMPRIEQVFAAPRIDVEGEAHARKPSATRCPRAAPRHPAPAGRAGVLLVSLSADSIGYKGMVLPARLPQLYPDLRRADLESSVVVFHQRFSTNTSSRWSLAQPFRMLAHNGEINTIAGNRAWAQARAQVWRSEQLDPREFDPVIEVDGSDSQSLDAMLDLLEAGGMDALKAMRILVPPATQSLEYKDADLAAFYEYYALNSEPWDGPAGIVLFDGRYAACTLDRNGLRPGAGNSPGSSFPDRVGSRRVGRAEAQVVRKGKLGPGQMIAADLRDGSLLESDAIDAINRARAPYKRWLRQGMTYLHSELIDPALADAPFDHATLAGFQKLFQLTREEREKVLRPLAEMEQEATGSMGDDVPMATLSQQVRPLYDRFRQAFAQVTNPPIDPLREDCVMSLATQLGREGNVFADSAETVRHVHLGSPVLSQRKLRQLLAMPPCDSAYRYIELGFDAATGMRAAIEAVCAQAEAAAREGVLLLILSDRRPRREQLMLHALLATGAVHQHLLRRGLRCAVNLIVETGTARDPHHFACLIGYGATAVYPYLAYQTLRPRRARHPQDQARRTCL
ncbi:glutamate synthase central domain-containing protein [Thermomonas sp.]|uniref:glutamate synthase central domain-containing protein n=1 Tax=Thermomonas sp. TaxID=1971895 RepID=UPI002603226B|nr:glutamate synthase central domain-containing protein [Thermomonas sp.]